MRRRRPRRVDDTGLFSPLLDVLMNALGAILLLLVIYVYLIPVSPPVMILSEDNPVYRFDSGSAEIPEVFRTAFVHEVLPRIEALTEAYSCDVIEVVGHTDGQPVQSVSNLDRGFISSLQTGDARDLRPGSNFDLGAMRALSVIALLKEEKQRGRLGRVDRFFPYSSGQSVLPGLLSPVRDDLDPDPTRRRIEIRLLRSSTWKTEKASGQGNAPEGP